MEVLAPVNWDEVLSVCDVFWAGYGTQYGGSVAEERNSYIGLSARRSNFLITFPNMRYSSHQARLGIVSPHSAKQKALLT